ncbi:Acetyltransferase (GNAT) family protein [Litoreibacter ascidiaceicola]|uniref:Acetyltransferase (GNAT) family protein n=1 Tax=Litoreibacter ascidiaceicola TaxID=1486859 RepID=A0A1M4XE08_9RHOB|nr:GNAT family N-acetyltransferase [Litoreibacter ascidiaceicola]SHE91698.1 Acetyltransferase (GNAT) family protein [Litoreibacter ascidiaceicola]
MAMKIRAVAAGDRKSWGALYKGYAAFYGVAQTDDMRDRVWEWLMDSDHEVNGFVAEVDGALVGLAHYRPFARPLAAGTGGFLDDLFVNPDARGLKVGEALISAVQAEGRNRGWGVVRWITADDNYRARGLYDRLATRTGWVTYDLDVDGETV